MNDTTQYAILCIVAVAIIVLGIILYLNSKKSAQNISLVEDELDTLPLVEQSDNLQELIIQLETLPVEAISDKNKLVEITDSKVLAHVNNLIPELAQVGNVANNAIQAVQADGEVLYRAVIPAGAKLADSQNKVGAVRGFYHRPDGKFGGHADFITVETQKGTAVVANSVAAMGVASMVVGQYYMNQINAELGEINDGISKISNFQNNEYRSKVLSLVSHVKVIADFQIEILENNELRLPKILQLGRLEEDCTQLLEQANQELKKYTEKMNLDYVAYENELKEAQNWYMYQKSLMDILYKIAELKYTLHLGLVSREQCVALLPIYTNQVAETQTRLTEWHQNTTKRLKIDVSEIRKKREGIDGAIHFIPGLIKEDLKFKAIEESTAEMIKIQSENNLGVHQNDMSDLYAEDVQLIVKDGKVYYLPEGQ